MPNQTTIERKIVAIMFTDIAGYTETMSQNEQKALEMLRKKRTIIKALIDNYNGKYVKEIGDGTLSYFESGFNASSCAKELQKKVNKEDLKISVGIHIGDIVFDNNDVYGDGVNIASRLESLAPAGGVLISKNVYDELINKDGFDGVPLGLQSLKGVGRLVEVYAIKDEYLVIPKMEKFKDTKVEIHTGNEVPSIAIIPFKNRGADEDVFYAYGISADLISDCSSAGLIRVSSLQDVEKVEKYEKLKVGELSKELDVRYITQGTLWKMGEIFQLSIELYDTKQNKVTWSDRWQENWKNLSKIKENLSDGLLKALSTTQKRRNRSNNGNTEAYEYYLKAKHKFSMRKNFDDTIIVRDMLEKAIDLDNDNLNAKLFLGDTYSISSDYQKASHILNETLLQSIEQKDDLLIGRCYNSLAGVQWQKGFFAKSIDYSNLSIKHFNAIGNKDELFFSHNHLGNAYWQSGKPKEALENFQESLKILKELDSNKEKFIPFNNMGLTYNTMGDFGSAIECLNNAIRIAEKYHSKEKVRLCHPFDSLGYSYLGLGKYHKALNYFNKVLSIAEDVNEKRLISWPLNGIGLCYFYLNDYNKAIDYLKRCKSIEEKIGSKELLLKSTSFLLLSYKITRENIDLDLIEKIIGDAEHVDYESNFALYKIFDDISFLKKSYKQIQNNLKSLDDHKKDVFLGCPVPKEITKQYSSYPSISDR